MSQCYINEQVNIFFWVPNKFIKSICINKKTKINYLMKFFHDDSSYTYIYNGNIVNSELTFKDAGISNGKIIIAIKKETTDFNDIVFKWINLTLNKSMEAKLSMMANKQTRMEFSRLQDIKNLKVEGSLKLHRKLSRKLFLQSLKAEDNLLDTDLQINYEPSSTPCTEAMPILW